MRQNGSTPEEFEKTVEKWVLKKHGVPKRRKPVITRLKKFSGADGSFKIDVSIEFEVLGGARMLVLVECKHLRRPVERDAMLILRQKIESLKANKGIVFSTSGFQAGAIEFAKNHGIGAVKVDLPESRRVGYGNEFNLTWINRVPPRI
jgi:restriction system protein